MRRDSISDAKLSVNFPLGVSNGLFLDADYYSDEDTTDLKFKTKFDNRPGAGNWAYIPIPYFIPSQLYNNLFANPAQYLQNGLGAGTVSNFASSGPNTFQEHSQNSPVVQLENAGIQVAPRGRLTRQASREKVNKKEMAKEKQTEEDDDGAAEDDEEVAAEVEETSVAVPTPTKDAEVVTATDSTSTTTTAPEEMTLSSTTTEAVNKLPSTGLNSEINSSTGASVTSQPSFEVGEWEYLSNGALPTTVNNTHNLKSNQTSSYYRHVPQSFDPDQVSFTTWFPEHGQHQDLSASSSSGALIASPFRPSEEYNENSLFQPVVGPRQEARPSAQIGLEPPVLPNYTYA